MEDITIQVKSKKETIGFVPTMGFLHQGHLSLVEAAVKENDIAVVSIFVNPTQFAPNEDYDSYPRDLKRDFSLLKKLKVDYVFTPKVAEMYPKGYNTYIEVKKLSKFLCGKSRPNHFRGVTTVVTKFFNIIQPQVSYFGQKDYQQLLLIKQLVADLNLAITIKGLPIVREKDGLALSSRNKYLNSQQRKAATILYRSLKYGQDLILKGEKDLKVLKNKILEKIKEEPLAQLDYLAIVDPKNLQKIEKIKGDTLLALAVNIGQTRLIDNFLVTKGD